MNRWYTKEEISFVKKNIKGVSYIEMIKLFNKRFGLRINLKQFEALMYKHKLRNGIGKIKPGNVPWNKGKKLGHYNKDHPRYKAIGSERILKSCNCSPQYVEVKVGWQTWDRKHKVIWEKANGKVPRGHVIIFADGNNRNFSLDNLLLVSRAELAVMNSAGLICRHKELTKIGKTIADIKMRITERKSKKKSARRKRRKA